MIPVKQVLLIHYLNEETELWRGYVIFAVQVISSKQSLVLDCRLFDVRVAHLLQLL